MFITRFQEIHQIILTKSMKITIHGCVCSVNAPPNPTQSMKIAKDKSNIPQLEFVEICQELVEMMFVCIGLPTS